MNLMQTVAYREYIHFGPIATTTVIYRLTVQTLPDSLENQFTPPDLTGDGEGTQKEKERDLGWLE